MKKLLFFLIVVFSSTVTYSQDKVQTWFPRILKGDWLAGGHAGYTSYRVSNVPNSQSSEFDFKPDIGYLFADKLAAGVRFDYTSYKQPGIDAYSTLQAAPFVRYYILPSAKKINLFGDVSYGFGSRGQSNKESYNYFGAYAGPAFFLNEHISLDGGLYYKRYGGDAYPDTYSSIGFRAGFQIHLGGGNAANQVGDTTPPFMSRILRSDWMVGGMGRYTSSEYANSTIKSTTFRVSPDFGYFFMDRFAGGLRVSYSSQKTGSGSAYTQFSADPFLRYYFLPATKRINIFGDASYGIGSAGSSGNRESFNYFGVMAGPALFLNEHVSLEGMFEYRSYGGDAYPDRENAFGFHVGFQIHLDCDKKK